MIDYFLDTSFLLPFFGMEINIKNIEDDFEILLDSKNVKFGYSDVSLVEIRFLVEKQIRKGVSNQLRDEYSTGLAALQANNQFSNTGISDEEIARIEIKLLTEYGYKDYFDRLIMASAYLTSNYLVTMDRSMKLTLNKYRRPESQFLGVINWNELGDRITKLSNSEKSDNN